MEDANYKILDLKIDNLKELMDQRDKLTELAISKSESTINERFAKANEFREQQKDIIATFARKKETDDAIANLMRRLDELIKSEKERSERVEMQTKNLINENAKVSNEGLKALYTWKESSQGSLRVILAIGGFLAAIVLSLVIAFFKLYIR